MSDLDPSPSAAAVPRATDHSVAARILLAVTVIGLFVAGLGLDRLTESSKREDPDIDAEERPVPDPGGADDFARADADALGTASSGQRWREARGAWAVRDGAAAVRSADTGVSLALLPVHAPNATVSVRIDRMAPGIGLAFRCRNVANCWRVEAVPDLGTWNLMKVTGGIEVEKGNLGLVPVADGTEVSVVTAEDLISVRINGEEALAVRDPEWREEGNAGLSLREPPSAAAARWSGFSVEPFQSTGLITVEQASIRDEFARDDATDLGPLDEGGTWDEVSGDWAIVDERAVLVERPASGPALALVDALDGDGIVELSMLPQQTGTGVAFRCRDVDNCLYLTAVPGFATWNLTKRVDGVETRLGSLPLVSTAPGLAIDVELSGSRIAISVNGDRLLAVDEPDLADETGIGLVATAGPHIDRAKWSRLLYAPSLGGTPA